MSQKVKVTKTVKYIRKTGGKSGYKQCNVCHGTGRVKSGKKSS